MDGCVFDFDEDLMLSIEAAILYDDIDFQTLDEKDEETAKYYYLQERRCGVQRTDEERRSISAISNRLCSPLGARIPHSRPPSCSLLHYPTIITVYGLY